MYQPVLYIYATVAYAYSLLCNFSSSFHGVEILHCGIVTGPGPTFLHVEHMQ